MNGLVRTLTTGCVTTLLALATPLAAGADLDPGLREKAQHAVDAGLHYLRGTQADDGSWSKSVGITALALRAYLESHRKYAEKDGAFITRPIEFILAHVNDDDIRLCGGRSRQQREAVDISRCRFHACRTKELVNLPIGGADHGHIQHELSHRTMLALLLALLNQRDDRHERR